MLELETPRVQQDLHWGGQETEQGDPPRDEEGREPEFGVPYRCWTPHPLPDPRSARISDVVSGLADIIAVEGPVLCYRAYRLYAKAAGLQRVGREIRKVLNRAMYKAVRDKLVDQRDEHAVRGQKYQIARRPGSPAIVIRTRADKTFGEIPPAEVAAVMQRILQRQGSLDQDELFQAVLGFYEIGRLTSNIRSHLINIQQHFLGARDE